MNHGRLEVEIYQIADDCDAQAQPHGWDGMGMGLGRLAARLDERDAAAVCVSLPAAHDRQSDGLVDQEPRRFHGDLARSDCPGSIDFRFDAAADSGRTGSTASSARGSSPGTRLFCFERSPRVLACLICGPANYFKRNAHPLTALIESDWISMSFTMNWKIMVPNEPVRFDQGEPLFQAIPLLSNVCADLENADVSYQKLTDDPELHHAYSEWDQGRRRFHDQKAAGEVKPD